MNNRGVSGIEAVILMPIIIGLTLTILQISVKFYYISVVQETAYLFTRYIMNQDPNYAGIVDEVTAKSAIIKLAKERGINLQDFNFDLRQIDYDFSNNNARTSRINDLIKFSFNNDYFKFDASKSFPVFFKINYKAPTIFNLSNYFPDVLNNKINVSIMLAPS